jgi:hypothetical protein
MRTIEFSAVMRAVAVGIAALVLAGASRAEGDKATYERVKASAKSTYDAAKARCDALKDNAKDICVAEAQAARTKTEVKAEAAYKDTPKARENAVHQAAEADYKVARKQCDDRTGNDKDVCIKVAKAALVRAKADAKVTRVSSDARIDASKEKREAEYSVAAQKCDAMTGDAKSACVKDAKAKYGM